MDMSPDGSERGEHNHLPPGQDTIDMDSSDGRGDFTVFALYPTWRGIAIILPALWYLLLPPLAGDRGVNSRAPMSDWNKAGTYNSQDECMAAKDSLAASVARLSGAGQQRAQNMLAIELSRCLASDDYRFEAAQPSSSGQIPSGSMQQQIPEAPILDGRE